MEDFITEIETLTLEKERIEERLAELCKPALDIRYAKWLRERIPDRDVYLMVALRLFSPKSLAGARMTWGKNLREVLCANMGVNKWYVSRQTKEVIALYKVVKSFRKKVNITYEGILIEIKDLKK